MLEPISLIDPFSEAKPDKGADDRSDQRDTDMRGEA